MTAALDRSWQTFAFRHELIDDHRHDEDGMDLRAELAHALRVDGWTQTSNGFRKRTAASNELVISYDRKPLGNQASAFLRLRSSDWEYGVHLWPRRDGRDLRIRSPATARRFAENIAVAAAHAIATWATPIEMLYGADTTARPAVSP